MDLRAVSKDPAGFIEALELKGYLMPSANRISKAYLNGVVFGDIKIVQYTKGRKLDAPVKIIQNAADSQFACFQPAVLHRVVSTSSLAMYDVPSAKQPLNALYYIRLMESKSNGLVLSIYEFVTKVEDYRKELRSSRVARQVTLDSDIVTAITKSLGERVKYNIRPTGRKIRVPKVATTSFLAKRDDSQRTVDIDEIHYYIYGSISRESQRCVIETLMSLEVSDQAPALLGRFATSDSSTVWVYEPDKDYRDASKEIILCCPDILHPIFNGDVTYVYLDRYLDPVAGWKDLQWNVVF